jgi:hypothetical protein
MGPTTNSPYGAADSLVKWIFKGYFQEGVRHMGAVTDWSKNEVYDYYGSSAINNNHMHMVFGCPEMDIYYDTSPITVISCDHPMPIVPGTHTFQVYAGGVPAEDVLVSVLIEDTLSGPWMDSYYSDASGNVTFDIPQFPDSSWVHVTATGFNLAPYLYDGNTGISCGSMELHGTATITPRPSPCFGTLSIDCFLPAEGDYRVDIYDISGRMVEAMEFSSPGGEKTLTWNGRDGNGQPVSTGIYFCRLRAPGTNPIRSFVLMTGTEGF